MLWKQWKEQRELKEQRKMSLCFCFDYFKKISLRNVASPQRFVMRGVGSLLLCYPSIFSRGKKVWYLQSFLKGFLVAHWKQWWNENFFCCYPHHYFVTVRNLHSNLDYSSQFFSPQSFLWLLWLFSFYIICSSVWFFSLTRPYSCEASQPYIYFQCY